MAKLLERHWQGSLEQGLPRRDRKSCKYEVYLPDTLQEREFTFDGPVAADIADAEREITRLNERAVALVDTEALARLLLRAESVASSRIEGLEVGARRLLRADAAGELGSTSVDATVLEVLANVDAMSFAIRTIGRGDSISVDNLLEIHRRLLSPTRLAKHAGRLRGEQNWIGGSGFNPCSASFVPPPPEVVLTLLEDLCAFCNEDELPVVAQAAIAHAQFETIHPFVDGNGRVGRTLIYLVMRRRGLITRVIPPISLVLATWAKDYVAGLSATRYVGSPNSAAARSGINKWLGIFASASRRAAAEAGAFEERLLRVQESWRKRLGSVRSGSAADLLLQRLLGTPILTVPSAARLIGRSAQAVNQAIPRFVEAGILSPLREARRNRAWEARELAAAFTDLERGLASPTGNTKIAPPTRRVPYRTRTTTR